MAVFNVTMKILQYLVVLFAILTAQTQGRPLQRKHNAHRGESRNNPEIEMEQEIMEDHESDVPIHRTTRTRHNGESAEQFRLDSNDLRARDHVDNTDLLDSLLRRRSSLSRRRYHAIGKRHNVDHGKFVHETMSNDEELDFLASRARGMYHRGEIDTVRNKRYEMEIKDAQNSSLCNYTVVDIPDPSPDHSRMPKNLFNVVCNHAGSRCRDTGTYCCVQTYSKIDVHYGDGTSEKIKILTGCVCSLRLYGELKQFRPRLPIDE